MESMESNEQQVEEKTHNSLLLLFIRNVCNRIWLEKERGGGGGGTKRASNAHDV